MPVGSSVLYMGKIWTNGISDSRYQPVFGVKGIGEFDERPAYYVTRYKKPSKSFEEYLQEAIKNSEIKV